MSLKSFFHPESFQGTGRRKPYFEGWYFKMVSASGEAWSFIPGMSLSEDSHAFIQVIEGRSGKTDYIRFPLSEFIASTSELNVRLGSNHFSPQGIELCLDTSFGKIQGRVDHHNWTPYRGRWGHPGIMGPFAYLPGMECCHGLNSAIHGLSGSLAIGKTVVDFSGGKGYSEKDWGASMPSSWIWLQCCNFSDPTTSLMLSIATIPWKGLSFTGFLGFLYREGRYQCFASYTGARLLDVSYKNEEVVILLKSGSTQLEIKASSKIGGELKAPISGRMGRNIKEGLEATIAYSLRRRDGVIIHSDTGQSGGLERVGKLVR